LRGWGLVKVKAVDFSNELPGIEKAFRKELGFRGMLKMACKLLIRPDMRKIMYEYMRIFKEYKDYIGYGCMVGRKPF